MSREEDLIRSTTHAIAKSVREVPPLRLDPAADELGSLPPAARRAPGSRGRRRCWWSWGAPLTAAAVIVAPAIALVTVEDMPNDGMVPSKEITATNGTDDPRVLRSAQRNTENVNDGRRRPGVMTQCHSTRASCEVMRASVTRNFVMAEITHPMRVRNFRPERALAIGRATGLARRGAQASTS